MFEGASFWSSLAPARVLHAPEAWLHDAFEREGAILVAEDSDVPVEVRVLSFIGDMPFDERRQRVETLVNHTGGTWLVFEEDASRSIAPDLPVVAETPEGVVRLGTRSPARLAATLSASTSGFAQQAAEHSLRAFPKPEADAALFAELSKALKARPENWTMQASRLLQPLARSPRFDLSGVFGSFDDGDFEGQMLLHQALDSGPSDYIPTLLRMGASDCKSLRTRAFGLLGTLTSGMGDSRLFRHGAEVRLPDSARPLLRGALEAGEDDYNLSQLLLCHGWDTHLALERLCDALDEELARDVAEARECGEDGSLIGYDLGCCLQDVLSSIVHAVEISPRAWAHIDDFYARGDGPLRETVIRAVCVIGGAEARERLVRWQQDFEKQRPFKNVPSGFEAGYEARFLLGFARLDGAPVAPLFESLFELAIDSLYASVELEAALPWMVEQDAASMTAHLARRLEGETEFRRLDTALRCVEVARVEALYPRVVEKLRNSESFLERKRVWVLTADRVDGLGAIRAAGPFDSTAIAFSDLRPLLEDQVLLDDAHAVELAKNMSLSATPTGIALRRIMGIGV